jgi:murein DD-endopeptidase MepM/ murein hydrolase activator NlpD
MLNRAIIGAVSVILYLCSLSANASVLKLSGELQQGGLMLGKTEPNSKVTLNNKPLKTSVDGVFAFGFGRDEEQSHELIITHPDGQIEKKLLTPAKRQYKIQRIEGIPAKIMSPDPQAVVRIKQDNQQIGQARSNDSDLTAFSSGFIAPIDGQITGVYGSQRVFNGEPKRPHFGLDYAGAIGDPVKAPAAGKVTLWVADMFYSGGTLIIDHGHGITSTFLHLSESHVKVGEQVKQGQLIARVGNSGRTTGPHLDWRVNWFNVRLDPALALKVEQLSD